MSLDESDSLIPAVLSSELERSIDTFNPSASSYLQRIGLPTENIFSPVEERKKVINALQDALSILSIEEKKKSYYLTKFTIAIAVGLFDGALNYLWNETISALRRLVSKTDLAYFFSVAEKVNSRNKHFSTIEDLNKIEDSNLLDVSHRIGLISDVNYKRLDHVNYMRNHVSAAHPNNNEIDAYEMLSWLTNCLRYVITAKPDHSVVSIKATLENIRTADIPESDFPIIGDDIAKLSQLMIDDLLWTLFGMYVDKRLSATIHKNVAKLAPYVWNASTEDRKYEVGAKFGVYRKNADISRKDATQEFLQIVNGQSYKDQDSLAGELVDKLGSLKSAHYGMNNFYNEYAHAKALKDSLPINGIIPRAARTLWVKVICTCYIGNGYGSRDGVDEAAIPLYKEFIENFTEAEIIVFLHLMEDVEFTLSFNKSTPNKRVKKLANDLLSISENIYVKKALELIITAPDKKLDGLHKIASFKKNLEFLPSLK